MTRTGLAASLAPWSGTLLMFALAATLGLAVLRNVEAHESSEPEPQASTETVSAGAAALTMPPARADVYFSAITERPLFSPLRRPTPELGQGPAAEPDPPAVQEPVAVEIIRPDLRLLGTLTGGERASALIAQAGGEPVWLRRGDVIGGWTLISIDPDTINLSLDSESFRLDLYPQ